MDKRTMMVITIAIATLSLALYLSLSFNMIIIPESMVAIQGQECVFLTHIKGGLGDVEISATSPSSSLRVEPLKISSRQVAEVTLVPHQTGTQTLTIQGRRLVIRQTKMVILEVLEGGSVDGEDPLAEYASEIHHRFIPLLAANRSEFGITSETKWNGTIVRPDYQVVMFYLFFSEEWEMGVSWHLMIPQYDWARIYLRHRFIEVEPSYAFEISSLTSSDDPHEINVEDAFAETVWR